MSFYREQLNTWLKTIEVAAVNVLDIGGGDSQAKDKIKSFSAINYIILDNDASFSPHLFADINQPWNNLLTGVFYNVVFCLEVMEYVYDPIQAHHNIADSLMPGGIAYISYPTIYPLHNPLGIDYLRYSKNAIEKYLTVTGFTTWEITPRVATHGIDHLKNFYVAEQMRTMKNTMDIYNIGYLVKAYKGGDAYEK